MANTVLSWPNQCGLSTGRLVHHGFVTKRKILATTHNRQVAIRAYDLTKWMEEWLDRRGYTSQFLLRERSALPPSGSRITVHQTRAFAHHIIDNHTPIDSWTALWLLNSGRVIFAFKRDEDAVMARLFFA